MSELTHERISEIKAYFGNSDIADLCDMAIAKKDAEAEAARLREALQKIDRRVNGNAQLRDREEFFRGYNAANDACREIAQEALQSAPPASDNQCDGCRLGLSVQGGIHDRDGVPYMVCTADRYTPASESGGGERCPECGHYRDNVAWCDCDTTRATTGERFVEGGAGNCPYCDEDRPHSHYKSDPAPADRPEMGPPCGDCGAEQKDIKHCWCQSSEPSEALEAIEKAQSKLAAVCRGDERWTMSVPARPDSDPDLVISDALEKAKNALSPCPHPEPRAALDALASLRLEIGKGRDYRLETIRQALSHRPHVGGESQAGGGVPERIRQLPEELRGESDFRPFTSRAEERQKILREIAGRIEQALADSAPAPAKGER